MSDLDLDPHVTELERDDFSDPARYILLWGSDSGYSFLFS